MHFSINQILVVLCLSVAISHSFTLQGQTYALTLTEPINGDTVSNLRPDFYWNAIGINERTSFSLKLVPINLGQNPADALASNSPILMQGPFSNNLLVYPSSLSDLDSASHYAWQVTFYDSGIPVAMSDVEDFYTPFPPKYNGLYWDLHQRNRNSRFSNDRLTINYNNRYKLPNLDLMVQNANTGELVYQDHVVVNMGLNYLDLSHYPGFPALEAGEYSVEISTVANESYYLIFIKE